MNMTCEQARNYSALFLRIGLGSLFLISWQGKLANPAGISATVAGSGMLAPPFDILFATALPYWELAFGVCFFLGLFTRVTSLGALLALTSYSIYLAQPASQARLGVMGPAMLSHDVSFMLAVVAMCISGAGAYSLDALIAARHRIAARLAPMPGTPARARANFLSAPRD
jgi:uncharacterized membrane protein YphA (DoxX/SURF4 family)